MRGKVSSLWVFRGALLLLGSVALAATHAVSAARPAFADSGIRPQGTCQVAVIHPTPETDLVVLSGGIDTGLRRGMILRVIRDGSDRAELLVVSVSESRAVTVVQSISSGFQIESGDAVRPKTIKI